MKHQVQERASVRADPCHPASRSDRTALTISSRLIFEPHLSRIHPRSERSIPPVLSSARFSARARLHASARNRARPSSAPSSVSGGAAGSTGRSSAVLSAFSKYSIFLRNALMRLESGTRAGSSGVLVPPSKTPFSASGAWPFPALSEAATAHHRRASGSSHGVTRLFTSRPPVRDCTSLLPAAGQAGHMPQLRAGNAGSGGRGPPGGRVTTCLTGAGTAGRAAPQRCSWQQGRPAGAAGG